MEGICSELEPHFSNREVGFCFVISDYDICTFSFLQVNVSQADANVGY